MIQRHPPISRQTKQRGGAIKWVLIAILLISVSMVVSLFFLDQSHYKSVLQQYVENATGRQLQIEGALSIRFENGPKLVANDVRFSNADWAKQPWAAVADSIQIDQTLSALLQGELEIAKVEIEGLQVYVENRSGGNGNWQLSDSSSDSDSRDVLPHWLKLTSLIIRNGVVHVTGQGEPFTLAVDEISLATRNGSLDAQRPELAGSVKGHIQSVPFGASVNFGRVSDLWSGQATEVQLNGLIGQHQSVVRASGSVEQLLRWQGVDLQVDADLTNLSDFDAWVGQSLPIVKNIDVSARLLQPDSIDSLSLQEVQAATEVFGVPASITGQIADLSTLQGWDFLIVSKGDVELDDVQGNDISGQGQVDIAFGIKGDKNRFLFDLKQASLDLPSLKLYSENGPVFNDDGSLQSIDVVMQMNSLAEVGELINKSLPDIGAIEGEANLRPLDGGFQLSEIRLETIGDKLDAVVTGNIQRSADKSSGKLQFSANSRQAGWLGEYAVWLEQFLDWVPDSEFTVNGDIAVDSDGAKVKVDSLLLSSSTQQANASGNFALVVLDSGGFFVQDMDTKFAASVTELERSPWLGQQRLSSLPIFQLSGYLLQDPTDGFFIDELVVAGQDERITLEAVDATVRFGEQLDVSGQLVGVLRSIDALPTTWVSNLPSELTNGLLPIEFSGQYEKNETVHLLETVRVNDQLEEPVFSVASELFHLDSGSGQWKLKYDGSLPRAWLKHLPVTLDESDVTLTGAYDVEMLQWQLDSQKINADISQKGFSVTLSGPISSIKPFVAEELDVSLEIDSIDRLHWLKTVDFASLQSASANIKLSVDAAQMKANGKVDVEDSDIEGEVSWLQPTQSESRNTLVVTLQSRNLDIDSLFKAGPKKTRLFSEEPFSASWLDRVQGRVSLTSDRFRNDLLSLTSMELTSDFSDGILNAHIQGNMGAGNIAIDAQIDRSQIPEKVSLEVLGADLSSDGVVPLKKNGFMTGGTMGIDLNIVGHGLSTASVAGSGSGELTLWVNDAEIENNNIDLIGGDLVLNMMSIINPFDKESDKRTVECGVLRFDIDKGVATNRQGFAFRTKRVTILGGGTIDLSDEEIEFAMRPKARKGFGINTTSVVKLIRLGGTLSDPDIEADPAGLLTSGVAIGAAIFSGGLSLIAQGLFDRSTANSDVCSLARNDSVNVSERENTLDQK